ncbi:hypothetical protein BDR26DRAFT_76741 [Obelidium mucronatum]|nr:hypothetical protein BDR26DRAFT_76741 [Obelidium mucronatum]
MHKKQSIIIWPTLSKWRTSSGKITTRGQHLPALHPPRQHPGLVLGPQHETRLAGRQQARDRVGGRRRHPAVRVAAHERVRRTREQVGYADQHGVRHVGGPEPVRGQRVAGRRIHNGRVHASAPGLRNQRPEPVVVGHDHEDPPPLGCRVLQDVPQAASRQAAVRRLRASHTGRECLPAGGRQLCQRFAKPPLSRCRQLCRAAHCHSHAANHSRDSRWSAGKHCGHHFCRER